MIEVDMGGETNLSLLLAGLNPRVVGQYIFCSVPDHLTSKLLSQAIGLFREREGTTLVIQREAAERVGLTGPVQTLITLDVHSSLESVGFVAAVAAALAAAGISVNIFAGFYHDHLFVPTPREADAISVLKQLSAGHSTGR